MCESTQDGLADDTASPPPLSNKHIIVAGAGISALAFVRALHRHWPSTHPLPRMTMYERGPKAVEPEKEGYSIIKDDWITPVLDYRMKSMTELMRQGYEDKLAL